jgi:enamine deaminase RidA (YjgF/YER057c/UK114 family)
MQFTSPFPAKALGSLLLAALPAVVTAQDIVRHAYDSGFPIAAAVEVPAGKTLVYLGGTVPQVDYPAGSALPDDATYEQALGVLQGIKDKLAGLGLELGDVIQMQVFLVGVPQQDGRLDFDGFQRAYTQFFGTEAQPNTPVRSVLQVAGLARPQWLVEIEVVAARP